MRRPQLRLPDTALVSAMAALTTWVTLLAWSPFSERPSTYLVPLLGLCAVIALSGMLLRAARLNAGLVLLSQLVMVGLLLHHAWAGAGGPLGGWLPTPSSLGEVGAMLSASADVARTYPAPVPKHVTAFAPLMVVAGTGTALVVDLVAGGLRRAPVAGLPLLAVYTAPVSILDGGVSWAKFVAAALCFVFLLTCQEERRLARWGQQVSGGRMFDSQETRVSGRAVWSSARRIGLTTTALAVVVPLMVPTLSLGLFAGDGPGDGPGDGSVSLTNPLVNMRRDLTLGADVDVVRVTTADPEPSYLRLTVLDQFDGEQWSAARRSIPVEQRAEGVVPRPPGLDARVKRATYGWRIETSEELRSKWLPAPYPVLSLDAPGDWRYDTATLDFVSGTDGQLAGGISYQLDRIDLDVSAEELAAAPPAPAEVFGPNTELPGSVPESVGELADQVTEGARSKFEMAQMLQRWFRVDGGFVYSLRPAPGNGVDDLVDFLADEPGGRTGYCEQFAAAMALMGRSLGIPSRVAVGFLRATPQGASDYVFSSQDLHAWPEMYFEGVGWLRFEPTPGGRTGTTPAYSRERIDGTDPSRLPSASATAPTAPNRIDETSAGPGTGGDAGGGGGLDLGVVLAGAAGMLGLLALLTIPRLLRAWVRARRWARAGSPAGVAEAAWSELRDTSVDLGLAWDDGVTVRSRARETIRSFGAPGATEDALTRAAVRGHGADPEAEEALTRLVRLVELARFARSVDPHETDPGSVRRDLSRCVDALEAGAGRRRRTRATWLPRSLWGSYTSRHSGRTRGEATIAATGVDHAV